MTWYTWLAIGLAVWLVVFVGGALAWFAGATRKPTPKPENVVKIAAFLPVTQERLDDEPKR